MSKTKKLPAREYLIECFEYVEASGVLRWKTRPRDHFGSTGSWKSTNTQFANQEIVLLNCGYIKVKVNGKSYPIHRIIWKIIHNEEPHMVDHVDGNKINNKLCNLRAATRAQNQQNTARRLINSSGYKGVDWDAQHKKWRSRICVDRIPIFLGLFDTKEAAYKTYCDAAIKYHKEFARFE